MTNNPAPRGEKCAYCGTAKTELIPRAVFLIFPASKYKCADRHACEGRMMLAASVVRMARMAARKEKGASQ